MKPKSLIWYLPIAALILLMVMMAYLTAHLDHTDKVWTGPDLTVAAEVQPFVQEEYAVMDYSALVARLQAEPATVAHITVVNGANEVLVEFSSGKPARVVVPENIGLKRIDDLAQSRNVKISAQNPAGGSPSSLALSFLPLLIVGVIMFVLFRKQGGGFGPPTKSGMQNSGARQHGAEDEKVTFDDVAGCEEAKQELMEVVEYLRDPESFQESGASMAKGFLLMGDPGNGKTLLARAVAGEAGVAFFSISGSQFTEMYVGVGASRVRSLFAQARAKERAIIFIDEIDAIGRQRSAHDLGGNSEREQTLNEILVQMDGFTRDRAIIVMAATNRPDILDAALLRPGRFDRHIGVDHPDRFGREAIFAVHLRNRPLAADVQLATLAALTPGFSGAEIASAANEAATVARRRRFAEAREKSGCDRPSKSQLAEIPPDITMSDFSEGIDRVIMGPARTTRAVAMSAQDKLNTAVHEVGHAAVGHALKGDPIRKITIMPRARALGFTLSLPEGDRFSQTRQNILTEIAMLMGGRAAQEVLLSTEDSGAANDFMKATQLARRMVTVFGMSPLGHISIDGAPGLRAGDTGSGQGEYGSDVINEVDAHMRLILEECYQSARRVIEENSERIGRIVERLVEVETMLGDEFEKLWEEPSMTPVI